MKKLRIIVSIVTLSVGILMLAACGDSSNSGTSENSKVTNVAKSVTENQILSYLESKGYTLRQDALDTTPKTFYVETNETDRDVEDMSIDICIWSDHTADISVTLHHVVDVKKYISYYGIFPIQSLKSGDWVWETNCNGVAGNKILTDLNQILLSSDQVQTQIKSLQSMGE